MAKHGSPRQFVRFSYEECVHQYCASDTVRDSWKGLISSVFITATMLYLLWCVSKPDMNHNYVELKNADLQQEARSDIEFKSDASSCRETCDSRDSCIMYIHTKNVTKKFVDKCKLFSRNPYAMQLHPRAAQHTSIFLKFPDSLDAYLEEDGFVYFRYEKSMTYDDALKFCKKAEIFSGHPNLQRCYHLAITDLRSKALESAHAYYDLMRTPLAVPNTGFFVQEARTCNPALGEESYPTPCVYHDETSAAYRKLALYVTGGIIEMLPSSAMQAYPLCQGTPFFQREPVFQPSFKS